MVFSRLIEKWRSNGYAKSGLPKVCRVSVAFACDLHCNYISLLERGRINITVNTARQIAHVFADQPLGAVSRVGLSNSHSARANSNAVNSNDGHRKDDCGVARRA